MTVKMRGGLTSRSGSAGTRRSKRNQGLEAPTVPASSWGKNAARGTKRRISTEEEEPVNMDQNGVTNASNDETQTRKRRSSRTNKEVVNLSNPNETVEPEELDRVVEDVEGENVRRLEDEDKVNDDDDCFADTDDVFVGHDESEKVILEDEIEVTEKQALEKEIDQSTEHNDYEENDHSTEQNDNVNMDQHRVNNESTEENQTPVNEVKEKKRRGPTKMRTVATDPNERVSVSFNEYGEHVGPGSVTLSSFLGPLVREHVPVTLADWRQLDQVSKDTMWEEIQGRFDMKEGWQKEVLMKQLGCLWRAGKSRLVAQVRNAKSLAERIALKPSNIPSSQVWNSWVKSKTSHPFKETSNRYKHLRKKQIPHTTSRKGMLRLAYEMKKNSADPTKITRSKIWIAGHTHADGRAVRPEFAETVEQIQSLDSQMDCTSCDNLKEDAVSKVLGKERHGRVRGYGRGISSTKLSFLQARDSTIADLKSQVEKLKGMVDGLIVRTNTGGTETSESVSEFKEGMIVHLLDWTDDSGDVVIGEGSFCSADPYYKVGRIPIGPSAAAIIVKYAITPEAALWRPISESVSSIGLAVGSKIAWPVERVIVARETSSQDETSLDRTQRCKIFDYTNGDYEVVGEGILCSTDPMERVNNIPIGPNAVSVKVDTICKDNAFLWRPTADMVYISDALNEKIAWPLLKIELLNPTSNDETPTKPDHPKTVSPRNSTSTKRSVKEKCILLDCNNSGRKVAEGRVASTDPNEKCHFVPIGPNATKVWVEVIRFPDAKVWRENDEFSIISDALGSTIPWPNDKLLFF